MVVVGGRGVVLPSCRTGQVDVPPRLPAQPATGSGFVLTQRP